MENITSKKALIVIVAIAIVGIVAFAIFNKRSDEASEGVVPETATTTATAPTSRNTVTTGTEKAPAISTKGNQPVTLSYQNALLQYKDDKRVQITGTTFCQVSRNNLMYKNGTSIMLDNRSAQTHTIKIDNTYVIGGYGFKIVNLSSSVLPKTFLVDCDKQQNITKILLQK